MAFVEHQEQRDHEVIEDVLYLIDEDECHIAEYVEVPKVRYILLFFGQIQWNC